MPNISDLYLAVASLTDDTLSDAFAKMPPLSLEPACKLEPLLPPLSYLTKQDPNLSLDDLAAQYVLHYWEALREDLLAWEDGYEKVKQVTEAREGAEESLSQKTLRSAFARQMVLLNHLEEEMERTGFGKALKLNKDQLLKEVNKRPYDFQYQRNEKELVQTAVEAVEEDILERF